MRKVDPVKHEAKRLEILQAAGRCFLRDGFRGASVSSICKEAGISAGHLYHYFDNKEAMIEAMIETELSRAAILRVAPTADPVVVLLEEFERRIAHVRRFEEMLAASGALVLKFWLHLPRKELEKRLRKAAKESAFPTRIVALIGQATKEALQVSIKAGADTAMAKPLIPNALTKKLKAVMAAEIPYLETDNYKGPDRRRIPMEDEYSGDERRTG